jgi:hypothetical protein
LRASFSAAAAPPCSYGGEETAACGARCRSNCRAPRSSAFFVLSWMRATAIPQKPPPSFMFHGLFETDDKAATANLAELSTLGADKFNTIQTVHPSRSFIFFLQFASIKKSA